MKKIYYDFEFTGLHKNTTPISIGMIADTGENFYAEFNDYSFKGISERDRKWLIENVINNLRFKAPPEEQDEHWSWTGGANKLPNCVELRGNTKTIAKNLEDWFQSLLGGQISWVDYELEEQPPGFITKPSILMVGDCIAYDKVMFDSLWGHALDVPLCVFQYHEDIFDKFIAAGYPPVQAFNINRSIFAGKNGTTKRHYALQDAKLIRNCDRKLDEIIATNLRKGDNDEH